MGDNQRKQLSPGHRDKSITISQISKTLNPKFNEYLLNSSVTLINIMHSHGNSFKAHQQNLPKSVCLHGGKGAFTFVNQIVQHNIIVLMLKTQNQSQSKLKRYL